MGTGVTLAVLPPETFARRGNPDDYGRHAASVTTDFGWHYRFDSKIERTVHLLARNLLRDCFLLFPKDGLGKFYD
jgi:hypothetical protein